MRWGPVVLAEQKKSWGPSGSQSKHESAAALQAGGDSLCMDSSRLLVSPEEGRPM